MSLRPSRPVVTVTVRLALLALALVLGTVDARARTVRGTLRVGSKARTYVLHVPDRLPAGKRLPLVFVFHGAGSTVRSMVEATGLDDLADRHGFLVAYPRAVGGRFNDGAAPPAEARRLPDDVGFVRALLAHLRRTYLIDDERVYAMGFSNGGMLCYRLAVEMADDFAAIAPVAAAMGNHVRGRPASPVSVIHVHGTHDNRVPYRGPGGPAPRYKSVPDTIATWVTYDDCAPQPKIDRLRPVPALKVVRRWHAGKRTGVDVVLLLVEGAGHTWPRGGQRWITRSIHAFFQKHPKPAAPAPAVPPTPRGR